MKTAQRYRKLQQRFVAAGETEKASEIGRHIDGARDYGASAFN